MNARTLSGLRILLTAVVVGLAALAGHALWKHYMYSPWTRDGRVRAEVIRIAPDVSGRVSKVEVKDNQLVHKGDVLFVIDDADYQLELDKAQASLAVAQAGAKAAGASIVAAGASAEQQRANLAKYQAQYQRRQQIQGQLISDESRTDALAAANAARAGVSQAAASQRQASASQQQALAQVQQAQAAVDTARLRLQRTRVRAPVEGYITNLDVRSGDYANAGNARLALIDRDSFWVNAYFEETKMPSLRVGDPVEVRLMSSSRPLKGHVESIAHGITDTDNPTGGDLLANVNPTYNWVRLAQRIPVRVSLDDERADSQQLAAGMTATVVVLPRQ
ncbi:biotin/lipoyl-binding protein [Pseudoxanthomonas dokdonensis]|uniref:Membrane protein n=1 Tax=Pseudoxanthomonas dokdonensis TaxID=344882 RepID=A0A0R0CHX7_9GAMM|nr:HlyD family secretion protein [Pseudoxanthomonas dokdonensis]KRG68774.1 membrane protein [Pseudoxanthomonas dokdonensis]